MEKNNNDFFIGFIGQGWIGGSYADDFENRGYKVVRYGLEKQYLENGHKISDCAIVFIAVPTPTRPEGFDDNILREVIKLVGKGKTAVIKSTVLPGTTMSIQSENPDIFVLHSPEFLTESTAAYDAAHPVRNIIGIPCDSEEYKNRAQEVLDILPRAEYEKICTDREAELIKYGGNCWFYNKVVYINMLFDLAESLECDWSVIREAMAADPRIGSTHLNPVHNSGEVGGEARPKLKYNELHLEPRHKSGRGAGGHCFIKDFAAFRELYKKRVNDDCGLEVINSLERKNMELLISTGKDLDLLKGVYGEISLKNKFGKQDMDEKKDIFKQKNKVLVTGGAGFIGFNVAKALLDRGDDVIVVDNFNQYYDPEIKKDRARHLKEKYDNVKIYIIDITDYVAMDRIFRVHKIDKVCHLAAQAGVRYSLDNPFAYIDSNIKGFLNLLELCRHHNIKDFIYASSSSVYGNNKKLPFCEEDRVDTPISLYAASKKTNEEIAFTYHHLFGLNCTGLRFFTVYGPWGRPDMALFKFTRKILSGKAIDVYNHGKMSRDFTYIDDISRGVLSAIDKSYPYEVFNLARGKSIKLYDFIKEIEANLSRVALKNMMPIQPGDVPETKGDISKAREMLDYKPRISVKEGVKNFIDWYKEYYQID
jgi:UDP-glucuronate 4-epimerase